MDSRLQTSGMTEGPAPAPLSYPPAPSSCPPGPSVLPAGPLCPAHRAPLSCPPAPLSCPPGPLSCPPGPSVLPTGLPLSCPRSLAGIQGLLFCPFLRVTLHGKNHGFPITNVGNDRRARSGPFVLPTGPSVLPAGPFVLPAAPSVMPAVFSGNPGSFFLSLSSCDSAWEKPWIPDYKRRA